MTFEQSPPVGKGMNPRDEQQGRLPAGEAGTGRCPGCGWDPWGRREAGAARGGTAEQGLMDGEV